MLVAAYNAGDAKMIYEKLFSSDMRKHVGSVENEAAFVESIRRDGRLVGWKRVDGDGITSGAYEVGAERAVLRFEVHLDPAGKIAGHSVSTNPQETGRARTADKPPVDPWEPPVATSTLPLSLPFRGEWLVFWGGDNEKVNQHVKVRAQRRAADLDKVDASGNAFKNDGKANEDHYCFGADVLAVADGTVVTAVDGIPDNAPGEMNTYFQTGNGVILAHADGVHSVYAHLKKRSVRVHEGDKVKRGQVIGLCGNSGNSSQPHLHFQLQDGPRQEMSWGIDAVFQNVKVLRDGKTGTIAKYTFLKGDRIQAQ
jgi:hypothetical protein